MQSERDCDISEGSESRDERPEEIPVTDSQSEEKHEKFPSHARTALPGSKLKPQAKWMSRLIRQNGEARESRSWGWDCMRWDGIYFLRHDQIRPYSSKLVMANRLAAAAVVPVTVRQCRLGAGTCMALLV